ncbi:hypothetical protein O0L34_g4619 [Tuta absoluta]|nr:hypothetical protein O0L34_g4619 [Tuta absoluta]
MIIFGIALLCVILFTPIPASNKRAFQPETPEQISERHMIEYRAERIIFLREELIAGGPKSDDADERKVIKEFKWDIETHAGATLRASDDAEDSAEFPLVIEPNVVTSYKLSQPLAEKYNDPTRRKVPEKRKLWFSRRGNSAINTTIRSTDKKQMQMNINSTVYNSSTINKFIR